MFPPRAAPFVTETASHCVVKPAGFTEPARASGTGERRTQVTTPSDREVLGRTCTWLPRGQESRGGGAGADTPSRRWGTARGSSPARPCRKSRSAQGAGSVSGVFISSRRNDKMLPMACLRRQERVYSQFWSPDVRDRGAGWLGSCEELPSRLAQGHLPAESSRRRQTATQATSFKAHLQFRHVGGVVAQASNVGLWAADTIPSTAVRTEHPAQLSYITASQKR